MQAFRPIMLISSIAALFLIGVVVWMNDPLGDKGVGVYQPRPGQEMKESGGVYEGAEGYYRDLKEGATQEKVLRSEKAAKAFSGPKNNLDIDWIGEGPVNQGGRTRSILLKGDESSEIWAGSVSGGIWRSTDLGENWEPIPAFDEEVIVSTMTQLGNGNIYVGTGNTHENPSGTGSSGFIGRGLYYTTDDGNTFELVPGTLPDSNSSGNWTFINEIEADPTNNTGMWVAYSGGVAYFEEDDQSFTPVNDVFGNGHDVEVSSDGQYILVTTSAGKVFLSQDGGDNFEDLNAIPNPDLPSATGRAEVAISQTDKDYMYVSMADNSGKLSGVHMSSDGGDSWGEIAGSSGGSFKPFFAGFQFQGVYDNAISVRPEHPGTIVLGGVTLWKWKRNSTQFDPYAGQWSQLATTNGYPATVPFYVHADVHEFKWRNKDDVFIGTDGGVFRSDDGLNSFLPSNKGYTSTQFYSVEFSPDNQIMGGTQDNGTQYLDREGRWDYATRVRGGDGFACEISHMDPSVVFATTYGPQGVSGNVADYVWRSENDGGSMGEFITPNTSFDSLHEDFHSNIALYEDPYDSLAQDSVEFYNDPVDSISYEPGDTIHYQSRTVDMPLTHVASDTLGVGDTIDLFDPVQSLFAFTAWDGGNPYVYVTRQALELAQTQVGSHQVLQLNGGEFVNCYAFSNDGDDLWVGTRGGTVYRISGLDSAYSGAQFQNKVTSQQVYDHSSICTGIDVDPNDPDHVVLSFGGYGGSGKVRESFDARDPNPTFNSIWDNSTNLSSGLINMPVYDVMIEMDDPNVIFVGTEYGVFATDDGGNTWGHEDADPLGNVPVFEIDQQRRDWDQGAKNPGYIYLGTHGKGLFKSTDFQSVRPDDRIEAEDREFASLGVYPNPADQRAYLELPEDLEEDLNVRIFDLQGKEVHSTPVDPTQKRDGEMSLPVSELEEGIYIVRASSASYDRSAKLVVSR